MTSRYSSPPTEADLQDHLSVAASHNALPAAWARKILLSRGITPDLKSPGAAQAANAALARMQAQIDALTKAVAEYQKANPGVAPPVSPVPTAQ